MKIHKFLHSLFLGAIVFLDQSAYAQTDTTLYTTTVGVYPKPSYALVPYWLDGDIAQTGAPTKAYDEFLKTKSVFTDDLLDSATKEVVIAQLESGIDIPTDGEVRRENYIHYHCRHLNGIDFDQLEEKLARADWRVKLPVIRGKISTKELFLARDYQVAQIESENPVKMTLPGPLTMMDTLVDAYYYDDNALVMDLARALNQEVLSLVEAGCKWIQIDEPVWARKPEKACELGENILKQCFANVPDDVNKVLHICCGYPHALDQDDYKKADPGAYSILAPLIEASVVDAVSIEDAHQHNDLALLKLFKTKKVILGVIDVSSSRIETVREIYSRLNEALKYIDKERLMVSPDCGLGLLNESQAVMKLRNMVCATQQLKKEILPSMSPEMERTLKRQQKLDYGIYTSENVLLDEIIKDLASPLVTQETLKKSLNLKAGDRVLDLGCGTGSLAVFLAENYGANVLALDLSENVLNIAKENLSQVLLKQGRVHFVSEDLNELDYPTDTFDAVVFSDILKYVDNPAALFASIQKSLRSGAQLVFSEKMQNLEPMLSLLADSGFTDMTTNDLSSEEETEEKEKLRLMHERKLVLLEEMTYEEYGRLLKEQEATVHKISMDTKSKTLFKSRKM
jgi:5-methyltetrahydropteroyltriglutamate--homocysteine methyltransferase